MFTKSETNNAIIVKLQNVQKHPNADRLQLATVLGTQVIIGLDMKEGDLVIYFDSNLCLSSKYIKYNNLFSSSELNLDPKAKGYFPKSGKVRAIKFRESMSNGFVAPITSLLVIPEVMTKISVDDIGKFSEGLEFTHIGGVEICSKYTIPVSMPDVSSSYNQKKTHSIIIENFWQHWDTKQVMRNLRQFGDTTRVIYIEEKIHGCVPGFTRIHMADGSIKRINKIKVGDLVLGYNELNGSIIPTKVINTYINGKTKSWIKIQFDRIYLSGGEKQSKLICTDNHKILTGKGWKEAKDIFGGDVVFSYKDDVILTDIQKSVILGKLLGDGSANLNRNIKMVEFSHAKKHLEYFNFCYNLLGNISVKENGMISGFGTKMLRARTRYLLSVTKLIESIYDSCDGKIKRKITDSVVDIINPLSIAIWYMDDGSLSHSEFQKDRALLAVCRYDDKSLKIIKNMFSKFDIYPVSFQTQNKGSNKKHWRLRFNFEEAEKLFLLIREYIPPSMQYKLPEYHRGFFKNIPEQIGKNTISLIPQKVKNVKIISSIEANCATEYDIETESHNYIAQGIIIHNSSGRTGNVLVKNNRPWWKFWIPREEWKIISGTRRVDSINGHINTVRKEVEDKIKDYLHKGEQVYYEIFGYNGYHQIQKGFKYGCCPEEYKVLLYRVTITTPDGKCYDLDREQVYARARELGLVVPTHERHLMDRVGIQEVCKKMFAMKFVNFVNVRSEGIPSLRSSLDSDTLFEGFVFWFQDDKGCWTCLKHKSEEFLEFTSKQMDNEIGDPEDNL